MKYVIVTGSVISGLGKGITASSIGLLLKSQGFRVTAIKIDPYLNVDAGTMSPYEQGECYVLQDGGETDLDLGNYERFLGISLTKDQNITTGKIYSSVIHKERAGKYLGKTVQIVPHITNEIKDWIKRTSNIPVINDNMVADYCIIELGGVIGDLETNPFIEALRQMAFYDKEKCFFVHVGLVLDGLGKEIKTKPMQHSIAILRQLGIFPDLLVIRSKNKLPEYILDKLSLFCHIDKTNIISNYDTPNIYYVPNIFLEQHVTQKICKKFKELSPNFKLEHYFKVLDYFNRLDSKKKVRLVIAGKYVGFQDTYLSLIRAIEHASIYLDVYTEIHWLNTEDEDMINNIGSYDGIIIPGGFGDRGILGKLLVCKYARKNDIPLLGICLGLQVMVTDSYNMTHCGKSEEWTNIMLNDLDKDYDNVVHILLEQDSDKIGGTMRLGNYVAKLKEGTKVRQLYNVDEIVERHRHRYEVNNDYLDILEKNGLTISGVSDYKNINLVEIVERPDLKFFVGCQFHPEYNTSYERAHPLFIGLIQSMMNLSKA